MRHCIYCGKELGENDPKGRPQCTECSVKRMRRMCELQLEAKDTLAKEFPVKYNSKGVAV